MRAYNQLWHPQRARKARVGPAHDKLVPFFRHIVGMLSWYGLGRVSNKKAETQSGLAQLDFDCSKDMR